MGKRRAFLHLTRATRFASAVRPQTLPIQGALFSYRAGNAPLLGFGRRTADDCVWSVFGKWSGTAGPAAWPEPRDFFHSVIAPSCVPRRPRKRVWRNRKAPDVTKTCFLSVNEQVIHRKGHNEVFILEKQRDKLPIANDVSSITSAEKLISPFSYKILLLLTCNV